jgi:hypothetical protein
MTVRIAVFLIISASFFATTSVQAQVTGVVTHTSAEVEFRPGADGSKTVHEVLGPQIDGSLGGRTWGSGASFAATSRVEPNFVEFQNGNASGGAFSYVTSRTLVDISFTNDGQMAVTPSLLSTITPAGLGLFTDTQCLNNLNTCSALAPNPVDSRNFLDFKPGAGTEDIAGASFLFRITGDGQTLYELQGSLGLVYDPVSNTNILVSDLDAAAGALSGFRMVSAPGDLNEFSFVWDATDIDVGFPPGTLLLPGQSSTLTYETVVQSYSRAQCSEAQNGICLLSYSSFGDPIGRGGTSRPHLRQALAVSPGPSDDIEFDPFRFEIPTFKDGVLSFRLLPVSAVPEPSTWAMMILGFGLIGVAARRLRTIPATT